MFNLQRIAPLFLFKIEPITSLAISTASIICRPSTNTFFDVEITLANTPFNLLASTLVSHLYSPPTKLIGLKSFKPSSPPFFGINTRKVAFRLRTKQPESWNSLKKFITSTFTKSHEHYQKAIGKPSGPSAFSPQNPDNAPKISSTVKGFSNPSMFGFHPPRSNNRP